MADLFPFIGQSYQHINTGVANERTVNWWPEPNVQGRSKMMLLGAYGIANLAEVGTGPIWGIRNFAGYLWVVSGSEVYRVGKNGAYTLIGTLNENKRCVMSNNLTQVFFTNESNGYVIDPTVPSVTKISDGDFYASSSCTFQDGYAIFVRDGSSQVFNSDIDDATAYAALDFIEATQEADEAVAVVSDMQHLWIFKERTTEVWYNAANPTGSPFSPRDGAFHQVGIMAPWTAIRTRTGAIVWLGSDGTVYRTSGLGIEPVSHDGIQDQIARMTTTSDAYAMTYSVRGRTRYVLTFPTEERTFELCMETGLWNERESYGYGYWRASAIETAFNKVYVGDTESGKIGYMDASTHTEWGSTLESYRICSNIHANQAPVFIDSLEFVFDGDAGNTNDPGADPVCILKISEDNGQTWYSVRSEEMCKRGEWRRRAVFNRLGSGDMLTFRLSVSDPVKRDLIEVIGESEMGQY